MSKIDELFRKKEKNILSVYCTAGFPKLDDTISVLKALQDSGADMIELGMPYSDPLADGPVIQHSSSIALANGMTIKKLFEQLKDFRKDIRLPVLLMGYMNPILQYGFERFCSDAEAVGVDGLILPDLPMYEYETEYGHIIQKHHLDFVFLVTPETADERIKTLDRLTSGFIYAVSSSSTTGKEKNMDHVQRYLRRLKALKLKNPVLVGFGIKDKASFDDACREANGAIIGTAFIKALETGLPIQNSVKQFMDGILT
jgi:tryptophan synthase alpha chain